MVEDIKERLRYSAFKMCGKGLREDAASDAMTDAVHRIEHLEAALKAIRAKRYEYDIGTFTPKTAWDAAQKLNKAICEIFEIVETTLKTK